MQGQKDFREELVSTVKKICRPGHGILAADESHGTLGKKFVPLGVENTEPNRQRYRQLLFTTPDLEQYVSGVILFDETARQSTDKGQRFIDLLSEKGIVSGIKVDQGLQVIPGTEDENWTAGLDTLDARCKEYYKMGCRFAKWRAVLKIDERCPSPLAIQENAWGLARYAAICQNNGIVPIVEPEILSDGSHSIQVCQAVTERVNQAVYKALGDNKVFFEGMLFKPNMVTQGSTHPTKASPSEIAYRTCLAFSRSVVPSMPGIVFLSGGQSEEEASLNLNAINQVKDVVRPWFMSFSFGRALQNTCVKTWSGKEENFQKAQEALLVRLKANSQAQLGVYKGSTDNSGKESLFVADYKY